MGFMNIMKALITNELYKRFFTGGLLGLAVIAALLFCPSWIFASIAALLLLYILYAEWPTLVSYRDPFFLLITALYPVLPFMLIITMQVTGYEFINFLLLYMVAFFDTGSFVVGKKWGSHKISPVISPGKTWEGFLGGVVFTFIGIIPFFGHNGIEVMVYQIFPFTVVLCIAALCGDLFESYLKRRAGVKDSGNLLPGHGGLLDRIDGIMLAGIIVFILRESLKKLLFF